MSKPTFYTAFANSIDNVLPNLTEEAMKISETMQDLVFADKLYYIKDEAFSFERLQDMFTKYGKRIDIFYFSGHGVDGCLQLYNNYKIERERMCDIVNTFLENATLIFFNACETFMLAQQIIAEKELEKDLVIISCKSKINSIIAAKFATLLFKQIGQPGTYRDAYEQAKILVQAVHKDYKFKEFFCREDVASCVDEFDIGYIEIKAESHSESGEEDCAPVLTAATTEKKAKTSIIGQEKLTRDALTTNYVGEVVEFITRESQNINPETLQLLKKALVAAYQIARGEKKSKETIELFKRAAELLPGFSSASAFDSLINTEKNIDKPTVKNIIKSEVSGNTIGGLIDKLTNIKL
ncbi:hypothetical protein [Niastella sp. OAS944]|uniref:hypothetical protein n=1 Tax=Niastella sp. OAS944 TaxID=2664089 RepID=UPI00347E3C0D|nr:hypothetical protein [Chitinophagaceae bacterium OAS944]